MTFFFCSVMMQAVKCFECCGSRNAYVQQKISDKPYEREVMETRVAVISIIVEDTGSAEKLNRVLHEYNQYIIGRMGLPYREKGINIISIALDAPLDAINALTGAIGRIENVTAKAAFAKI